MTTKETDAKRSESQTIFDRSYESDVNRKDRLYRWIDRRILGPVRIGLSDWRLPVGGGITLFFFLLGTVGVVIVPEPEIYQSPPLTPAFTDWSVPLGTDKTGRGLLLMVVHATPAMLKIAATGAVVSVTIATVAGTVAGYKRGRADRLIMLVSDVVMTIPALPLVAILTAIYQPRSPLVIGVILSIDNWPGLARAIRSQVLTIREESYIEAARAMDISTNYVLRKDIISQLMPYITINAASSARSVIFESVALYFLGFLPFAVLNWGVMINRAYNAGAMSNPARAGHWLFTPMVVLIVFSIGLVLLSQGLDRVFNPKLRAKYSRTIDSEE